MTWRSLQLCFALGALSISGTALLAACNEAGAETTAPELDHTHPHSHLHEHDYECPNLPTDCLRACRQEEAGCFYDAPVCPPVSSVCHRRRALGLGDCVDAASDCESACWEGP